MKYLDGYPELDLLSKALSFSSPNLRVSTRIEAYSCKAIARERKLYKALEHDLLSDLSLSTSISPPEHHHHLINSAFGPLDLKSSRKTLWLLIATLNIAFADHDFSTLSAEEFVREENPRVVLASLTSALSHLRSSNGQEVTPAMPLVLEGYGRTASYSASAPSTSSSTLHNHQRKAIEQKAATSQQSSSKQQQQTKAQQGKEAATSSANGKKASPQGTSITGSNGNPTNSDRNPDASSSSTSPPSSSKAQQHQPRATKSNLPSSSTSAKKKKKEPPISHTVLISKLRNELDGTYEVPTHPLLRQVLDPIIDLSECEVYSYTPDLDSDPHAYQSEDEEEESDEEDAAGGDGDDDEGYDGGRQSDGLDMDLEDEDDTNPYYTTGTSIGRMQAQADEMQWEMEGVENTTTPSASAPGTPSASQQNTTGTFDNAASPSAATTNMNTSASARKSALKKRGNSGISNVGSGAKKSKGRSGTGSGTGSGKGGIATPTASPSRTKIIPGQSIFADLQEQPNAQRGPYQYGSLDDYSYTHHEARQGRRGPSSGLSTSGTDEDENDDDEADNGGLLWSSNYFFYNKKMKRILFVSCWGRKIGKQFSPSNALLARSAGNPLHAYRRQLASSYGHPAGGALAANRGRDGRVTINLNRPRAGSNLAGPATNASSQSTSQDENGSMHMPHTSGNSSNNKNQIPTSSLTQALRANAGTMETSTPLNTSFSSQPPIANAASIFRPSSPFPRSDNRPGSSLPPNTPSGLGSPSRFSTSPGDDPQPPMIRESASSNANSANRQNTPSSFATAGGSATAGRGARRVRPHSGASTPSRKTPKRNTKKKSGSKTPTAAGGGSAGPA